MRVHEQWPDPVDASALLLFALLFIGTPVVGYWLAVIDLRRYLRALRGALIQVAYFFPGIPAWARHDAPPCFRALGLELPCSEDDIKRAYWRLAKELHPDRGGDRRRFDRLRHHCESAVRFLRQIESEDSTSEGSPQ